MAARRHNVPQLLLAALVLWDQANLLLVAVPAPGGFVDARTHDCRRHGCGEVRFQRERERGHYQSSPWLAWDPLLGSCSRSPRVGQVEATSEWPSVASSRDELLRWLAAAARRGELREDGGVPGARPVLPRLEEFQDAAAGSSRLSKFLLSQEMGAAALSRLTLAPRGWRMTDDNACFCGHILTIGTCAGATIYGEGSHALQNLHRDWKETRLVDTCIAGCVGRKRIILLAPDEVTPRQGDSSRPALDAGWLRPLRQLPNDKAWQALQEYAERSDVAGGAIDITPGMFIFIPHGWWHALRPLDEVTLITGPSKISHHYHTEEVGLDCGDAEELRKLICSLPADRLELLQGELGDDYKDFLCCGTAELLQSLPIQEQNLLLDALQKVM